MAYYSMIKTIKSLKSNKCILLSEIHLCEKAKHFNSNHVTFWKKKLGKTGKKNRKVSKNLRLPEFGA